MEGEGRECRKEVNSGKGGEKGQVTAAKGKVKKNDRSAEKMNSSRRERLEGR